MKNAIDKLTTLSNKYRNKDFDNKDIQMAFINDVKNANIDLKNKLH